MIVIRESLIETIRRHGARAYPHECCGALLGRDRDNAPGDGPTGGPGTGGPGGPVREVMGLLPLDNRRDGEAARRRFLVTAEDHLRAEREARKRGLDIVGFYHSHPDHPSRPSEFDRDHALPWYSYLILRVAEGSPGETTSWRLADDRAAFEREPIRAVRTRATA